MRLRLATTSSRMQKSTSTILQVKRAGLSRSIEEAKEAFNHLAGLLTGKGLKVIFKGTMCCTTGSTIYLPELHLLERKNMTDAEVAEAQEFLETIRGKFFHESAHQLYTDMNHIKLEGVKGVAWNATEDVRVERKLGNSWPGAAVSLRNMHEWAARGMLGITSDDVAKFEHGTPAERMGVLEKAKEGPLMKEPAVGQAILGMAWVARTGKNHWFWKMLPPTVQKLVGYLGPEVAECRTTQSTAEAEELANRVVKRLRKLIEDQRKQKEEEKQNGKGKKGGKGARKKMRGKPAEGDSEGDAVGSPESGAGDDGESEGGEGGEDDQETGGKGQSGRRGGDQDDGDEDDGDGGGGGSTGEDDESDDGSGGGGGDDDEESGDNSSVGASDFSDDEIDQVEGEMDDAGAMSSFGDATDVGSMLRKTLVLTDANTDRYLVYDTSSDKVEVVKTEPGDAVEYAELLAEAKNHFGVFKRNLANLLKARASTRTITELEEGDLDTSLLSRLAVGTSDRVFKEESEQLDLENISVILLINESGSMSEYAGGSTRMGLAREATVLFAEVLDSLGVPFEVIGHTTGINEGCLKWGEATDDERKVYTRWGKTEIDIFKEFGEEYRHVKTRVTHLSARNNTHDGEVLLWAARRLLNQPGARRRILITVDDGEPYPNLTHSYSAPVNSKMEPREHHERIEAIYAHHQRYVGEVVKEVIAAGVEVIGMGMGTTAVRKYYPTSVVVNKLEEFPTVLLTELRKVLLSGQRKQI